MRSLGITDYGYRDLRKWTADNEGIVSVSSYSWTVRILGCKDLRCSFWKRSGQISPEYCYTQGSWNLDYRDLEMKGTRDVSVLGVEGEVGRRISLLGKQIITAVTSVYRGFFRTWISHFLSLWSGLKTSSLASLTETWGLLITSDWPRRDCNYLSSKSEFKILICIIKLLLILRYYDDYEIRYHICLHHLNLKRSVLIVA